MSSAPATIRPTRRQIASSSNAAPSPTLAGLAAEIAVLRDRVAVLEDQARGQGEDDRTLMRALVGSVGATAFSSAELLDHARIDRELAAALGGCHTAKHVGYRLRALAEQAVGGFVLRRVDRDESGTIWSVMQMSDDRHAASCPGADGGV